MQTIKVCEVSKNYREIQALNQITLELPKGKIYGLLGRNGAGKSTLLKIIAARIKPSSGQVLYDGEVTLDDLSSRDLYFSEPDNILPEVMTVEDFCLHTALFYPRFKLDEVQQILKDCGVKGKKRLSQLSTGYFALVRSLVALETRAGFILLDEPTLGHDAVSRELFYNELLRIYREESNTIVLSTHLIDEISLLLEEVIFLERGELVLTSSLTDILAAHIYLSGPTEQIQRLEGSYTIIERKEELGYSSVLVRQPAAISTLPSAIKVSPASLQDIFIAYSKKNRK